MNNIILENVLEVVKLKIKIERIILIYWIVFNFRDKEGGRLIKGYISSIWGDGNVLL